MNEQFEKGLRQKRGSEAIFSEEQKEYLEQVLTEYAKNETDSDKKR